MGVWQLSSIIASPIEPYRSCPLYVSSEMDEQTDKSVHTGMVSEMYSLLCLYFSFLLELHCFAEL